MNDLTISDNRRDTGAGRFYVLADRVTGKPFHVPSVTTILDIVGKPALINWSANHERGLCTEAAYQLFTESPNLAGITREHFDAIFAAKLGKTKSYRREMDKAASIGTEAHKAAERRLRELAGERVGPKPTLSDAAAIAYAGFEAWLSEHEVEVVCVEQVVGSIDHGFAGTLDAILIIDGVPTLADLKTSRAVYDEHFVQLSAYDRAVAEMIEKDGWAAPVPKDHVIIRLPKKADDPDFELHRLPAPAVEIFEGSFLPALQLWKSLRSSDGWARREA